jgi:hypothetical protein
MDKKFECLIDEVVATITLMAKNFWAISCLWLFVMLRVHLDHRLEWRSGNKFSSTFCREHVNVSH